MGSSTWPYDDITEQKVLSQGLLSLMRVCKAVQLGEMVQKLRGRKTNKPTNDLVRNCAAIDNALGGSKHQCLFATSETRVREADHNQP